MWLEHKTKNLTTQGAYVLADAEGKRQAIIIATGSEVEIALAARDLLQTDGIGQRVFLGSQHPWPELAVLGDNRVIYAAIHSSGLISDLDRHDPLGRIESEQNLLGVRHVPIIPLSHRPQAAHGRAIACNRE